ncbi:hypothetical protein GCM10009558_036200 [Virgisporangium aurantiacum]
MTRFQFVADHSERFGVKRLCQIVGVARSSLYYWRSTATARAARDAADRALAGQITAVHRAFDGTYGAPRITAELSDNGPPVNRKRAEIHECLRAGRLESPLMPHAETLSVMTTPRPCVGGDRRDVRAVTRDSGA